MLNLKPSIHLHEIVFVWVQIENELDSSGIVITNSFGSADGWATDRLSDLISDIRWCLLHDFLMSSLDGTVPLIEVNVIFMFISENLNLDMPRPCDVPFDDHSIIFEGF